MVLIGTLTGALLATMVALEDNSPRIAALVLLLLISPAGLAGEIHFRSVRPRARTHRVGQGYSFRPEVRPRRILDLSYSLARHCRR